ncbi:hypothetical protein HY639_06125 [Candidatus Woesearchaeota archaeon]|nr:hypothetical protein [Candidatus Woesearchaeota archaeon]
MLFTFPELLFTVIAVSFCLAIYYRTKESYELTKYPGIKYFRDAFLFFGFAYAMRFVLLLVRAFEVPRSLAFPIFLLPLGYFSTIALFYLVFSLVWKHFSQRTVLIGHGLAVLLPVISFLTRSHELLLSLQALLLVVALVLIFREKVTRIRMLYLLVFVLWLLTLLSVGPRWGMRFIPQTLSLLVFTVIYSKIAKWMK